MTSYSSQGLNRTNPKGKDAMKRTAMLLFACMDDYAAQHIIL